MMIIMFHGLTGEYLLDLRITHGKSILLGRWDVLLKLLAKIHISTNYVNNQLLLSFNVRKVLTLK